MRTSDPESIDFMLRQELEKERQRCRALELEKQTLLKQFQLEQQSRIEKTKDKFELEARLKTAESEALKSTNERHNLEKEIR